jgi:hypothetical protein
MQDIRASDLPRYFGKQVKVVYVGRDAVIATAQGAAIEVEDLITPPVLLRGYDGRVGLVTIERHDGRIDQLSPKHIFPAE